MILDDAQAFAESLVVYDFSFAQEADRITDFGVFDKAQDVIIGRTCFLFCSHIFMKIGYRISFRLEICCGPWRAAGRLWPESQRMVDIIFVKAGFFYLLRSEIFGELVDDCAYDLHVGEFFCTDIR